MALTSSFTWLDYSERDRQRMLDVVDLFKEQGTRDELGIGSIRDAFSDRLFPGTGTVQTRARYFLFVPWVYLDLERKEVPSAEIARKARAVEVRLIDALANAHRGQREGVIGIEARAGLKRLPSNIYWLGLSTWGIRRTRGSQEQYHRSVDRSYRLESRREAAEEPDASIAFVSNWHSGIPKPPPSFPDKANFKLRKEEAVYLRERIMASVPDSLLAFLVDKGRADDEADFPWQHPQWAAFPAPIREQLEHARNFSEAINGAALLYNLMLAEKSPGKNELVPHYQAELKAWAKTLRGREDELSRWDLTRFRSIVVSAPGVRVSTRTWQFVDAWLKLALSSSTASQIKANPSARDLIHRRETSLKGNLARLDNLRALELWNGAAGTGQLDYRWRQASTIISDILRGQKDEHA